MDIFQRMTQQLENETLSAKIKLKGIWEFLDSLPQDQLENIDMILAAISASHDSKASANYWLGIITAKLAEKGKTPWDGIADFGDLESLLESPETDA